VKDRLKVLVILTEIRFNELMPGVYVNYKPVVYVKISFVTQKNTFGLYYRDRQIVLFRETITV
jgi:hypothetical protein